MSQTNPRSITDDPPTEDQTRTLKNDAYFAVFDPRGDVRPSTLGEEGVYHHDARYLSEFTLSLSGRHPLLLGSTIQADDLLFRVDLTNPDLETDSGEAFAKDTLHIRRDTFLHGNACRTRIQLHNYGECRSECCLQIRFDADFKDIFEIRGVSRLRRGTLAEPRVIANNRVEFEGLGLDDVRRRTAVRFNPPPSELRAGIASYDVQLRPRESFELDVLIEMDARETPDMPFNETLALAHGGKVRDRDAVVWAASERATSWITRSAADLNLMVSNTEQGVYPYAGLPWFNTVFGRDGILSALMYLWVNPDIAKGVLKYLAAHQATEVNQAKDAEPGKILHEHRAGEMAVLDEVPYRNYYGTVDATPLFVVLAEAYFRRTADLALISDIWPNIKAALRWIDEYGDLDGDGFIEYQRQSHHGILSQGWKDSDDAISHADGRLAESPIALCEVQGYAYAARKAAANLALAVGQSPLAAELNRSAETLKERFATAFWSKRINTYALALDANKSPCEVKSSNAGHCLFSGIASDEQAEKVVGTLFSSQCFSGWGIRTLAKDEARFNPMSYHNGSVWPHDNAMIAYGLARYGYRSEVLQVVDGLFGLCTGHDLYRMEELYCGFDREKNAPPTMYPVACSPQAWAAASVFFALQAMLGMDLNAIENEIRFNDPILPHWLPRLVIHDLRLNDSILDLSFQRDAGGVAVNVPKRRGSAKVMVVKQRAA